MKLNLSGDIVPNDDKWVYDWLGYDAVCPNDVHEFLEKAAGEPVDVYINSGGGDVFAGSEIYEALRDYSGEVTIHVIYAASAASVIMCARRSVIAPTGMVMVHNVAAVSRGDYHAMDKSSEILQKANQAIAAAYTAKSGKSEQEVLELMDRETWLTGQEAVDAGLVDAISEGRLVAAGLGTIPHEVIDRIKGAIKNPFRAQKARAAQAELDYLELKGAQK